MIYRVMFEVNEHNTSVENLGDFTAEDIKKMWSEFFDIFFRKGKELEIISTEIVDRGIT